MDELQKLHDELLSNKPESISDEDFASLLEEHKEQCPFCNPTLIANDDPEERGDMDKEFTQAELDNAVTAAVAPIQKELEELKATLAESEVDSRVAEAKADAEAKITELQEALDAAELRAGNAETERDNIVVYLESVKESSELAELASAIREDRKAKIQEVANFTEDYIEANLDRWCAEDEEAFAARLEEWKVASVPKATAEVETASLNTAVQNIRPVEKEESIRTDVASFLGSTKV